MWVASSDVLKVLMIEIYSSDKGDEGKEQGLESGSCDFTIIKIKINTDIHTKY